MSPPLQFIILLAAGWVNRHQQNVIEYLEEENRALLSLPETPSARERASDGVTRGAVMRIREPLPRGGDHVWDDRGPVEIRTRVRSALPLP